MAQSLYSPLSPFLPLHPTSSVFYFTECFTSGLYFDGVVVSLFAPKICKQCLVLKQKCVLMPCVRKVLSRTLSCCNRSLEQCPLLLSCKLRTKPTTSVLHCCHEQLEQSPPQCSISLSWKIRTILLSWKIWTTPTTMLCIVVMKG